MLHKFANELWIDEGPLVSTGGFHYGTRMAVIRLANGELFVWSPIPISSELQVEMDSLGSVRHVVAPNSLHHLFLGDWARVFPHAKIYAPPGLRSKRRDICFDGDIGADVAPAWAEEIDVVLIPGNLITTEAVFFHRASRTVLFTDLLQNFPKGWFSGWRAVVARLDLMLEAEPTVPRKFRNTFVNRRAARRALARICAWPAEKVLMAHGDPVENDGRAFILRAFRWLNVG